MTSNSFVNFGDHWLEEKIKIDVTLHKIDEAEKQLV
jgi:hypothetical protein